MRKDDLVYVGDMSDRVAQVLAKVRGVSRGGFDADENLRFAVLHLVQDLGEAASRVSLEFRRSNPAVPWTDIVGMRHRIVHDYTEVDFRIVWDVATGDLPALAAELARLAPPLEPEVRDRAAAWGAEPALAESNELGRMLPAPALTLPPAQLGEWCRRWRVRELALFGSVLRGDFRPDSDIDVLVTFEPNDPWSVWDIGDMRDELSRLFGRPVDLVERAAVEQSPNPIRRRHILENHRVVYAATAPDRPSE
jgi:hypothetical protein